ncbi:MULTISPECIES: GNAT family N-acetyltransferase [unclassified Polaribacter]|uniref:GNAT family N-acetyltransferase n=1 Tax=unclassified Polaribacter TaxID=196858 RepID=UPI0011BE77FA|nr:MULTISPECIES: GNAT family N-acetyltransferase [unclassified Polaribacter]TXD53466.1 GNAT family N-acetyltransferase [Polaribacter sp. IC063]TXD57705.1 GNAT family N-acetyltransferase [Polaribacter sp. IC066]
MLIRTAELEDLETLLTFEQGVIEAEKPLDPFLGTGDLQYYNIPELITAKDIHFLVVVADKELIASGYVRLENSKHYHKNPQHGYIGFIFVKPSFRGQRVSTLLLKSLKDWSLKKDLKELRLDVYSNNVAAIKAYERFGFSKSLVNMRMGI